MLKGQKRYPIRDNIGLSNLSLKMDIIQNKIPEENISVVVIIKIVYSIIYNIWGPWLFC